MTEQIIKIPKTLIIGGINWTIEQTKINGGCFYWGKHLIQIDKKASSERKFNILFHEISEVVMVNCFMRFQKPLADLASGDYLFSFNHDSFEIFCDELAGIIRQIIK